MNWTYSWWARPSRQIHDGAREGGRQRKGRREMQRGAIEELGDGGVAVESSGGGGREVHATEKCMT